MAAGGRSSSRPARWRRKLQRHHVYTFLQAVGAARLGRSRAAPECAAQSLTRGTAVAVPHAAVASTSVACVQCVASIPGYTPRLSNEILVNSPHSFMLLKGTLHQQLHIPVSEDLALRQRRSESQLCPLVRKSLTSSGSARVYSAASSSGHLESTNCRPSEYLSTLLHHGKYHAC